MNTFPAVGCINPQATASVVVLPAPLGPSSATTEPGRHRQIHTVQHLDRAVGRGDAAQLQQRRSAG